MTNVIPFPTTTASKLDTRATRRPGELDDDEVHPAGSTIASLHALAMSILDPFLRHTASGKEREATADSLVFALIAEFPDVVVRHALREWERHHDRRPTLARLLPIARERHAELLAEQERRARPAGGGDIHPGLRKTAEMWAAEVRAVPRRHVPPSAFTPAVCDAMLALGLVTPADLRAAGVPGYPAAPRDGG